MMKLFNNTWKYLFISFWIPASAVMMELFGL